METLRFLTSNYLIDVAFVAWLSAQVLKTLLYYLDTNTFRAERWWAPAGCPAPIRPSSVPLRWGCPVRWGLPPRNSP